MFLWKENLSQALGASTIRVFTKISSYTPSNVLHTANIRPCVEWSLANA